MTRLDLAPVLTMADVADLFGLQSVRAARRLVARLGIPHVPVGKRIVVLLDSLVAWLRDRERKGVRADAVREVMDRVGGRGSRTADTVRRLMSR